MSFVDIRLIGIVENECKPSGGNCYEIPYRLSGPPPPEWIKIF